MQNAEWASLHRFAPFRISNSENLIQNSYFLIFGSSKPYFSFLSMIFR